MSSPTIDPVGAGAARAPRRRAGRGGVPRLRRWQERALRALEGWERGPFLISAAPGAGKTRPALQLARDLLARGAVRRIVVLCPTAPLTRQWATAAGHLGVQLVPDADNARVPRGFHGAAVTYARVLGEAEAWARTTGPEDLVVADEAHHLGEDLAWGEAFAHAFGGVRRRLLLSGTPFRSDATPIPGVTYDDEGLAVPDVSYDYAAAVRDGVCRPVVFITYDGELSWRSGDDVIESSFATVLSTREAARRYRTAISTELPDGLPRIVGEAHARLMELRAGDGAQRDAGGLAVAADAAHARRIAALLAATSGRPPLVVLHTDPRAAEKLGAFRTSREPWIVAVNMVSEGVDIPRLRVGIYASAAKTALIFRQIVGRFVRTIPGRAIEPSWVYLPADPVLCDHAASLREELRRALRQGDPGEEADFAVAGDELRGARGEETDFVPLSADVAPQMTLFGGGPPPTPAVAASALAGGVIMEGPSAFEEREALREQRHRLVADLARRDGRSHQEINGWLNRALGIGSVRDASNAQLQRSVELLLRRLTGRR